MTRSQILCRILGLSAAVLLAGCQQQLTRVYEMPQAAVHHKLKSARLQWSVFDPYSEDYHVSARDPSKISWIFESRNQEVFRMVAELEPAGAKATRVRIHMIGVKRPSLTQFAQKRVKLPEISALLTAALREQIDATMEDRPFMIENIEAEIDAARKGC